ncbi:hypothetical protein ACF0H5_000337 [Mactra antiquata]
MLVLLISLLRVSEVFSRQTFDGLKSYDKYALPTDGKNGPLLLKLNMNLLSIANMDLKYQTVSVKIDIELSWMDLYLVSLIHWTKGNVSTMSLDSTLVWVPDIMISTYGAYGVRLQSDHFGKLIVRSDGLVKAWVPVQVELTIDAEITHYPFDVQTLNIYFSLWTLPNEHAVINVPTNAHPFRYYRENGEWSILSHKILLYNSVYDNQTYTDVLYTFIVQRQSLFPVLSLVVPVVLTSSLNVFVYILPVQGGERLTLCVSVFLTLAVFLSILDQSLPKTSKGVSIFIVYLCLQLLGSALTIVSTCVVLNLYEQHQSSKRGCFYRFLSTILCKFETCKCCKGKPTNIWAAKQTFNPNDREDKELKENKSCLLVERIDMLLFLLSITWNVALLIMVVMTAILV